MSDEDEETETEESAEDAGGESEEPEETTEEETPAESEDADEESEESEEETPAESEDADEESEESEEETPAESEDADESEEPEEITEEYLTERLESIQEDLEAAETEDDLDAVDADLDEVESQLESADLPEPDDEDEEGPADEIETEIADLREDVEEQRGPYAEDVADDLEDAAATVEDTEWTETGEDELVEAVESFLDAAGEVLDESFSLSGESPADVAAAITEVKEAVESADLDPDRDADAIAELVEAADELAAGIDDAEEWDDLSVREQLAAQGFYDVLDHRKDYPPEWHAVKVHERENNPEMILLAMENLDSDFMVEHCMESLRRLGSEEALDAMDSKLQRRNADAVEVVGKIASEESVEDLLEFVDAESDPQLQKATLKALGEIGSHETTQDVANQLAVENAEVRSQAARALGLIGDTRAVEPLADVLSDDDSDNVRASAAWALTQIGTERALEEVEQYADDPSYIVQAEAEKVA